MDHAYSIGYKRVLIENEDSYPFGEETFEDEFLSSPQVYDFDQNDINESYPLRSLRPCGLYNLDTPAPPRYELRTRKRSLKVDY